MLYGNGKLTFQGVKDVSGGNEEQKRFYSWSEEPRAVAFLDLVGFKTLTKLSTRDEAGDMLFFTLMENCILPIREAMKVGAPRYRREVPLEHPENGDTVGFWYQEVPLGAVNFAYMSDSAVLYSSSLTHLFEVIIEIYARAMVFAVPLRGAIALGRVHHSEWIERPGLGVCLYGSGVTKAVELEKRMSGTAMRVALDDDVVNLAAEVGLAGMVQPGAAGAFSQLKWWLNARLVWPGMSESQALHYSFSRWFTERHTAKWFGVGEGAKNRSDAERVIAEAVVELQQIGK